MQPAPPVTPADIAALFACRAQGGAGRDALHPALRELVDGPDDAIARAHETRGDNRRSTGAFYTPPQLGGALVDRALRGWNGDRPPTVLDPSCGCGNMLVLAAERLVSSGADPSAVAASLFGVDIDPVAIAIARGRIDERLGTAGPDDLSDRLRAADFLRLEEPPSGCVDVVVGNPPFGNAIERATRRTDEERAYYRQRFPEAATGSYDKASLFVEGALRWTNPAGRVALVLPRALLSASYAARLRRWIDQVHRLESIVTTADADHFSGAAVYVTGAVFAAGDASERGARALTPLEAYAAGHDRDPGDATDRDTAPADVEVVTLGGSMSKLPLPPDSRWSVLLSPHARAVTELPPDWPRLDSLASIQAGAAAGEAYEILPHVANERPDSGWKLVTTGLIDPFSCLWGERTCRYLKHDFATPWVPRAAVSARRAALYDRPKVMVAGLSRELEAVLDPAGELAGAVATLAITVEDDDPSRLTELCRFLNSPAAREQFLALHGAQALGGGSVQVTKRKLAELRVPRAVVDRLQRC